MRAVRRQQHKEQTYSLHAIAFPITYAFKSAFAFFAARSASHSMCIFFTCLFSLCRLSFSACFCLCTLASTAASISASALAAKLPAASILQAGHRAVEHFPDERGLVLHGWGALTREGDERCWC